ncbi:MAG: TetR/AcrR family transcriptional regulator [Myxococcaceae bacterium]
MIDRVKRREALLQAARDVFVSKGYHDARVDDIVVRADVAKGTFYLYFQDKRSIFSELVDGVFARIGAAIIQVDTSADIESQVRHNMRAVIAVLTEDPALTRILLSYASGLDAAFVEKLRSFYEGVRVLFAQALTEGQHLGLVAPGDPRLYASFTIGALKEILFEAAGEQQTRPREELVDALFNLLQSGYLRIPRPRATAAKSPARPGKRVRVTRAR